MSGHVVGRQRRWPWAILSLLFAVAFVWSFAVSAERIGGVSTILRIGLGVALVLSLLRLLVVFISSRRARRARKADRLRAEGDEGAETEADGQQPAGQPSTEERAPTYEEVFGAELELDVEGLPLAPEDEEWSGGEGAEVEAEGQPPAEQPPTEESAASAEEELQPLHADLDEAVDRVEAVDTDGEFQEHLRRMREEFKARAEEAALRVKQREAELHEAASAADPER